MLAPAIIACIMHGACAQKRTGPVEVRRLAWCEPEWSLPVGPALATHLGPVRASTPTNTLNGPMETSLCGAKTQLCPFPELRPSGEERSHFVVSQVGWGKASWRVRLYSNKRHTWGLCTEAH